MLILARTRWDVVSPSVKMKCSYYSKVFARVQHSLQSIRQRLFFTDDWLYLRMWDQ
jgi:hypothetical protein